MNAWNGLLYTILANSYCSRWQNPPKLRHPDSHCTVACFTFVHQLSYLFLFEFFSFWQKILERQRETLFGQEGEKLEETEINNSLSVTLVSLTRPLTFSHDISAWIPFNHRFHFFTESCFTVDKVLTLPGRVSHYLIS